MAASRYFISSFLLGGIIVSMIVFGVKDSAFSKIEVQPQKCLECHEEVYSKSLNRIYIHKPFIDRRCSVCHIDTPDAKEQKDLQNIEFDNLNLKWIRESNRPEQNHWFLFSADEIGNTLYLNNQDAVFKKTIQKIEIPRLEELTEYRGKQSPLKISNLEVVEVQRGIFISAKIRWETNRITTSRIDYGYKILREDTIRYDFLSNSHEIELHNLKKNQTYELVVEARDPYGNKVESDILTFSTLAKDLKLASHELEPFQKNNLNIIWDYTFFRCDDKYLLHLSANKPALVSVGISLYENNEHNIAVDLLQEYRQPPDHKIITSRINTNNEVCFPCHVKKNSTYSHPVNVFPKPGMTIPDEYPTLPDGRITCMSCHASHASDHEYRLVKSSKRDLCIGCHTNMQ